MSEEDEKEKNVMFFQCKFCGNDRCFIRMGSKRGQTETKCEECGNENRVSVDNGEIVKVEKLGKSLKDFM